MAEVLESPEAASAIDKHGMGLVLEEFPSHCREALKLGLEVNLEALRRRLNRVSSLVFLGMGGSAVGGSLLRDWAYEGQRLPIEVCRDSRVPGYLGGETLTVAVSYSGNTYETLKALEEALAKGSPAFTVSSGGKLAEESLRRGLVHVRVPGGFQPRAALPYLMIPVGVILERLGILEGFQAEVEEALSLLEEARRKFSFKTPLEDNPAKRLALTLHGGLPAIYGFREYSTVAYRFKTQLNENSKIFCKWEVFPELNHNEVVGWEKLQPFLLGKIRLIIFRDEREPEDLRAMIEAFKEVTSGRGLQITEVYAEGRGKLSRMLYLVYLSDYVSFYLALLNGVDPTPIASISSLKRGVEARMASR
ncbi:MAG: bifunctional phosphoglucose/phosphomannose isomerase [Candidatus Hecatellales archaeon]|nr:MAG: bifunctional phosphoglucose/phosphomannose isomerase [Candidatus Hecatellales archaeon]